MILFIISYMNIEHQIYITPCTSLIFSYSIWSISKSAFIPLPLKPFDVKQEVEIFNLVEGGEDCWKYFNRNSDSRRNFTLMCVLLGGKYSMMNLTNNRLYEGCGFFPLEMAAIQTSPRMKLSSINFSPRISETYLLILFSNAKSKTLASETRKGELE